jgi:hypothetical protein
MPPVDHFPSTHATWIDAQLTIIGDAGSAAGGAREALRRHLWDRYHAPLRAYVHGGSFRRAGEPDDLVAGFFADRVTADDFLPAWRRSGMPLRRWMMNGMGFYARGVVRDRLRDRLRPFSDMTLPAGAGDDSGGTAAADALLPADERTAEDAFERAWAIAVLDAAHAQVHAQLADEGRLDDYEVFRRRVLEREGYDTVGPSVGKSAQQCAGSTRLVSQRMAAALRDVLRAEGVREGDLEETVREVQRGVGMPGAE